MGGDGGQVIDRATMVKTKGWGLTKGSSYGNYTNSLGEMANYVQMTFEDRGLGTLERHRTRMSQCFLSQEALRNPVVACRLGNLYNKEALIGALLNKSIPQHMAHIKKLSDVKGCLVTWKEAEKEDGKKRMVCPLTREDLDTGGSRATVIWSTGAVVSVKALKALKAKDCPVTGKAFDAEKDLITLAPDDEELAKMRERLPASKKRKAGEANLAPEASSAEKTSSTQAVERTAIKDMQFSLQNCEQTANKAKKREIGGSDVYKKLFTADRGEAGSRLAPGLSGPRDAFGKPAFNAGTRCM